MYEFSVIKAYLLPLSYSRQWVVRGVQPIASNFNKRCIYAFLTLNWCEGSDSAIGNLQALHLRHSDTKLVRGCGLISCTIEVVKPQKLEITSKKL